MRLDFSVTGEADGGLPSEHAALNAYGAPWGVEYLGALFMRPVMLCPVPNRKTFEEVYRVTMAVGVSLALR